MTKTRWCGGSETSADTSLGVVVICAKLAICVRPAEVAAAETRVAELEAAINDVGIAADYQQLAHLAEDYAAAKAQLDDLYAEWEEMAG